MWSRVRSLGLINKLWESHLIHSCGCNWECGLLSIKIAVCREDQEQCAGMEERCQHKEEAQDFFLGGVPAALLDW
jgi:hypothetical protein